MALKSRLFPLPTIALLKIVNIIILGVGLKVENIFPGSLEVSSSVPRQKLFFLLTLQVYFTLVFFLISPLPQPKTPGFLYRQGAGRRRWEQSSSACSTVSSGLLQTCSCPSAAGLSRSSCSEGGVCPAPSERALLRGPQLTLALCTHSPPAAFSSVLINFSSQLSLSLSPSGRGNCQVTVFLIFNSQVPARRTARPRDLRPLSACGQVPKVCEGTRGCPGNLWVRTPPVHCQALGANILRPEATCLGGIT